jgi:hypothetical protein
VAVALVSVKLIIVGGMDVPVAAGSPDRLQAATSIKVEASKTFNHSLRIVTSTTKGHPRMLPGGLR